MMDVGQGDAILIQTGSQTILVDTGDDKYYEDGKKGKVNNQLFDELQKANVTAIDKLIMTHAHADHIGKAAQVIEKYGVKEVVTGYVGPVIGAHTGPGVLVVFFMGSHR